MKSSWISVMNVESWGISSKTAVLLILQRKKIAILVLVLERKTLSYEDWPIGMRSIKS